MVSVLPGIVFLEARMVTFNRKRQPIGSANTTLNPLTLAGATLLMILVTVIIMIKSSYSFQQFSMGCILETALTTLSTEAARHDFRQAPIILPHSKHHTLTELVTKQSESARPGRPEYAEAFNKIVEGCFTAHKTQDETDIVRIFFDLTVKPSSV